MPRKQRKIDSGLRWGEGFVDTRTTKSGETRFVARWPEMDGLRKTWRGKTFRTEDEAEDHLRSIARRKRDGAYTPESRITVSELVAMYMERKKFEWSPNTYATMKVFERRTIIPYLGDERVTTLTKLKLQQWLDTLAKSGRRSRSGKVSGGLSRSVIANTRSLLMAALEDAVDLEIISANPASRTKAGGTRTLQRPVWSDEQAARMVASVTDNPWLCAFYGLALATGMRAGELRALRWQDVDLDAGLIAVRSTITRNEHDQEVRGDNTKTKVSRQIPIEDVVVTILRKHRQDQMTRRMQHPAWHADDIVFDRGDGRFIPQDTLQVRHRRAVEAAGLPHIRLHDLRHTHASLQADAGVNPKIVMETLGHASLEMTLERYTHPTSAAQRRAVGEITRRLFAIDPDTTTSDEDEAVTG